MEDTELTSSRVSPALRVGETLEGRGAKATFRITDVIRGKISLILSTRDGSKTPHLNLC